MDLSQTMEKTRAQDKHRIKSESSVSPIQKKLVIQKTENPILRTLLLSLVRTPQVPYSTSIKYPWLFYAQLHCYTMLRALLSNKQFDKCQLSKSVTDVLQTIGRKEKQKGADTRKAPMDMFGNLFMQTDNNHEEKEGAALLH